MEGIIVNKNAWALNANTRHISKGLNPLIKCDSVLITPLEEINTDIADEFQFEVNTFFRADLATNLSPDELEAFLFAGIATEGGEIVDIYKKERLVKGKMDVDHLTEELGDLCWHISALCTHYNIEFADVLKASMDKFRKRWPRRFFDQQEVGTYEDIRG